MEYEKLKTAAESITMPDDMKCRIVRNCKQRIGEKGKETTMKNIHFRKSAAVFAAVAICLSLTVAAMAAPDTLKGFFRDITDWRGAVVGTSYEQATDEISMSVAVNGEELTVLATFVDPQIAPYKYVEWLGIAEYKIVNEKGKSVEKGTAESAEILNGQAVIKVPLDGIDGGNYKLVVTAFVAEAKAEQPLQLHGHWESEFTK